MNFVQTLRKRSELQPGVPALIDRSFSGHRILTYSALNRLVDFLSFELREEKIEPGDHVLFGIDAGQEMYGYLLAALQIGAVPILYDDATPHGEFNIWVNALKPKFCLIPKEGWMGAHFDGGLRKIPSKIFVGHVRSQTRWLRLGKLGVLQEEPADAVALVCLVREPSGHLALRAWSQRQLSESVQFLVSQLKLKAGEIDLCGSPLHLLANLAAGLTSVVTCGSPRSIEHQVEKFKPTRVVAESSLVRRLLRKSFSPLHRVFLIDSPIEPEAIDYFSGHIQHTNFELIFYQDLPLASISLKEYERKGSATLVGSFFSGVQARVLSGNEAAEMTDRPDAVTIAHDPEIIGQLVVRGHFLPIHQTLADLSADNPFVLTSANGDWCSTGAFGYFDHEARFWLTERAVR